MNQPPDEDLRALFARQRHDDHASAPAWRDEWLRAAPAPQMARRAPARRWLPVALGTACLALAAVLWMPGPAKPQPDLSEALPPLFDTPPGELFADLGPSLTVLESPSDFLLPDPLQSSLNLPHLP